MTVSREATGSLSAAASLRLCAEGEVGKVQEVLSTHPSAARMVDADGSVASHHPPDLIVCLSGMTPLHWACDRSRLDVCRLLLDSGADVNAKDYAGETPLSVSAIPTVYYHSFYGVPKTDYDFAFSTLVWSARPLLSSC